MDAKQVRFLRFRRQALLQVIDADGGSQLIDAQSGNLASITEGRIFAAARDLMPSHRIVEQQRLTAHDNYWYSHHEQRQLPVLRVLFDDEEQSSFYLDPATGEVLDLVDDGARRHRWWFSALHRLDLSWLRQPRPLWYLILWSLNVAGLVISISGVVIGWRRLRS